MLDQLFEKTLDSLYPVFRKYAMKYRGFHATCSLSDIKLWYEFCEWAKTIDKGMSESKQAKKRK